MHPICMETKESCVECEVFQECEAWETEYDEMLEEHLTQETYMICKKTLSERKANILNDFLAKHPFIKISKDERTIKALSFDASCYLKKLEKQLKIKLKPVAQSK